jgi:hypothetical protein
MICVMRNNDNIDFFLLLTGKYFENNLEETSKKWRKLKLFIFPGNFGGGNQSGGFRGGDGGNFG